MSSTSKFLLLACLVAASPVSAAPAVEREPVTMSVVAVNPSADNTKVVPVKIDLPQEVTPKDVLDTGELSLEYDEARKAYYVFKDAVALGPKETRVFSVTFNDVWIIPQRDLDSLENYTGLLLKRLEKSEYFTTAKPLAESVVARLKEIAATQNDEALSRKGRIGAYRIHLQVLQTVKEDLARIEKLLTFTGGPPVPEMLEESPLKSDAPSTTTTWLVIFLVLIFVGLLGAQFFFTWHRRGQVTQELSMVREAAYGGPKGEGQAKTGSNGGTATTTRHGGP